MRGSGREGAGIEEGNAVLATAGIQQRVPATADQVPYLRAEVLAFCDAHLDLPNDVRDDVRLAVTEACTNAVLHAYPSGPGEVTVTTRVDDHQLTVEVSDEGVGIDTGPPAAASAWASRSCAPSPTPSSATGAEPPSSCGSRSPPAPEPAKRVRGGSSRVADSTEATVSSGGVWNTPKPGRGIWPTRWCRRSSPPRSAAAVIARGRGASAVRAAGSRTRVRVRVRPS